MPKETKGRAEKHLDQRKDEKWAKGSAKAKAKHGMTLNQMVKRRDSMAKGSRERIAMQNAINESMGVSKRHKISGAESNKAIVKKKTEKKLAYVKKGVDEIKKTHDTKTKPAVKKALKGSRAVAGRY